MSCGTVYLEVWILEWCRVAALGKFFTQDFRAFMTLCGILLLFTYVGHLQYYAILLLSQVPQAMLVLKHLIFFVYT